MRSDSIRFVRPRVLSAGMAPNSLHVRVVAPISAVYRLAPFGSLVAVEPLIDETHSLCFVQPIALQSLTPEHPLSALVMTQLGVALHGARVLGAFLAGASLPQESVNEYGTLLRAILPGAAAVEASLRFDLGVEPALRQASEEDPDMRAVVDLIFGGGS